MPISDLVLSEVIDGLSAKDRADVCRQLFKSLFRFGETTAADLEMTAGYGGVTGTQAEVILNMFDVWLADVEAACEMAWERSGVGHDKGFFRPPIQLLRVLLADLSHGESLAWIRPAQRKAGDRSDKRFEKALKDRAAQTIAFLTEHGINATETASAIASLVSKQMKTLPIAGNPLPSSDTLIRRAKSVPALPAQLRLYAASLLAPLDPTHPDHSAFGREQRITATIAALLADPVNEYFLRPRPNEEVK